MRMSTIECDGSAATPLAAGYGGLIGHLLNRVPRPLRFLGVGAFGLFTDLCVFSLLLYGGITPLPGRALSLVLATTVTWRLNRLVTFDPSGRDQHDAALPYTAVTAAAQGTSYVVFSVLVLTVLGWLPQAALIVGAAVGALVSYHGHRLVSFAPRALARTGTADCERGGMSVDAEVCVIGAGPRR
jgi:putative flippase GtrA